MLQGRDWPSREGDYALLDAGKLENGWLEQALEHGKGALAVLHEALGWCRM